MNDAVNTTFQVLEEIIDKLNEKITKLEFRIKQNANMIDELSQWKHPSSFESRFYALEEMVADNEPRLSCLEALIENIRNEKLVETITNEELLELYKNSGIPLKQIADDLHVKIQTAHKYVHGGTKDLKTRQQVKNYFLDKS